MLNCCNCICIEYGWPLYAGGRGEGGCSGVTPGGVAAVVERAGSEGPAMAGGEDLGGGALGLPVKARE